MEKSAISKYEPGADSPNRAIRSATSIKKFLESHYLKAHEKKVGERFEFSLPRVEIKNIQSVRL